jgi:hypothetical protein
MSKARALSSLCGIVMALFMLAVICDLFTLSAIAADKWAGVDEAVIEKVSKENGREASPPLINTDKGDLLLFVFLVAGVVGGFMAGYSWRTLTEKSHKPAVSGDRQ